MPRKKRKKLTVPPETLIRPRLDALLTQRRQEDLDDAGFVAGVKAMMDQVGHEPVLNALIAQLDNADAVQRDLLMNLILKLEDKRIIPHLWRLVKKSRMSLDIKMEALVVLKQLGEDIDLEDPGAYLPWRDVKEADIADLEQLARTSTRALMREIQKVTEPQELERFMLHYEEMIAEAGGEQVQLALIKDLVDMDDTEAADMLQLLVYTMPNPKVRQAAQGALATLAQRDISPKSPVVKELGQEAFYAAYSTDPAHPWQQQVSTLWERPGERVQAIIFLLDFGHPWNGSIKDMIVTRYMTKSEWQREFIEKGKARGVPQRRVPFTRARQFILDALAANKKHHQPLPSEYDQFRHLIERRIINPSPEALAQAEAVPIEDEWGPLPESFIRGLQVINTEDGSPVALPDEKELDLE